jgi:5-methylcytosine-specific restriction endonuclease McrA
MQPMRDHLALEEPKNIPASTRERVLERDRNQCRSCGTGGENKLTLHHIVYRSQGGGHLEENLVTLCLDCHRDIHEGYLDIAYVEWYPGLFDFFCSRLRPPFRWRKQ